VFDLHRNTATTRSSGSRSRTRSTSRLQSLEVQQHGYILSGIIVTRVAGMFYGEFSDPRGLPPLGMRTARVISDTEIVPNRPLAISARRPHSQPGLRVSVAERDRDGSLLTYRSMTGVRGLGDGRDALLTPKSWPHCGIAAGPATASSPSTASAGTMSGWSGTRSSVRRLLAGISHRDRARSGERFTVVFTRESRPAEPLPLARAECCRVAGHRAPAARLRPGARFASTTTVNPLRRIALDRGAKSLQEPSNSSTSCPTARMSSRSRASVSSPSRVLRDPKCGP